MASGVRKTADEQIIFEQVYWWQILVAEDLLPDLELNENISLGLVKQSEGQGGISVR